MLNSLSPQLTNQQFINCAFLERPPSRIPLLFYRTALILVIGDSLTLGHRENSDGNQCYLSKIGPQIPLRITPHLSMGEHDITC